MVKALMYFIIGTLISFFLRRFTGEQADFWVELYVASAFGIGWGLAYFVDHPEWPLPKKMGISLIGIVFLVAVGLIFFDFETAVPSIIKFSTVFVAYYMIASFRESKSLRY
ncbi:MAG: hypothetical protein DI529_08715 [Chryseobacterium sp.]|nr:MAG: hypothetical protein DI529_08715 [Chryseobacterium sp.]